MDRCPQAVLTLVIARDTEFNTRSSGKSHIKQNCINTLFQNTENLQLLLMTLKDNILTVNTNGLHITLILLVFCKTRVSYLVNRKKMLFCSFLTDACKNPMENLYHLSMVFMNENNDFHRILAECFLQVITGRYLNLILRKNTVVRKATCRYIIFRGFLQHHTN